MFYFKTLYRNYQRISIQESPGTVPPGRIPRSKEILLLGDLCDTCRPGDEIVCVFITFVSFYSLNIFQEVLGVYRNTYNISLNIQNNLPVFATIIEANYISTREDKISFETLTDEDIQEIQRLAKEPKIAQRVKQILWLFFFSLNLLIIFRFTQVLDLRFMVMKWLKKLLHLRCLVVNQKIPVGITNFLYSHIMRLM